MAGTQAAQGHNSSSLETHEANLHSHRVGGQVAALNFGAFSCFFFGFLAYGTWEALNEKLPSPELKIHCSILCAVLHSLTYSFLIALQII